MKHLSISKKCFVNQSYTLIDIVFINAVLSLNSNEKIAALLAILTEKTKVPYMLRYNHTGY